VRIVLSLCAVLLLAACSSPDVNALNDTNAGYQQVSVNTPGQSGANCFMQSGSRSYSISAPATVSIQKSPAPMTVTCFKGEHMIGTQTVRPTVSPREEMEIMGTAKNCVSCNYPGTIIVAMQLDPKSFERDVKIGP
jgi:hypothetical protein